MTNLNVIIEDLIQKKADDFLIAKEIKFKIKDYLNSLNDIFNTNQGKDFFIKHTKKIDIFIKVIYKYLLRKHFDEYIPLSNCIPITLIALGSYGREQLCIYSDIDIMVLYKDIDGYNLKPIIEEFISMAWDSGLKLGSRVHEINEIQEVVKTDITIKTSIIESRLIYGSDHLWIDFNNYLKNIRYYQRKEFILEKLQEHKERLIKYPINMQPNIKDGYGGLRESHMLFWLANITYGVSNTKYLSNICFSEDEYKIYRVSLEYIYRVRNALHLIAKKKLDTITFDILPQLASKLGFKHTTRLTKERQCMTKLFESLHNIHNFTSNEIKKISRQYIYNKYNLKILKVSRLRKNLYLYNNKIYTSYHRKNILLDELLNELLSLPTSVKEFDNSYVYWTKNTLLTNITNSAIKHLIRLLLKKENLYPIIKLLYNAKLFITIFPFAKQIINQPQFDGYHIHPVDIHTLNTLKHINNIQDKFVANIFNDLDSSDKSLLNILLFFHDIGKGRKTDHNIVGAIIFKDIALDVNISKKNIDIGIDIIRYHNHMSYVATTQDIFSQRVILNFTALIKTKKHLDLLYCLTYADIKSVGDNVYNHTNSSLLKQLYLNSLDAFENKELLQDSARRIKKENAIKNNIKFKELPNIMKKKILNIQSNQLFFIYKASDIIQLALDARHIDNISYSIENNIILQINIIRVRPINLGYLLGKLSFLNISAMHIFKLYDEKKYFHIEFTENIDGSDISFIEEIIENSYNMDKKFNFTKPIISKSDIEIDINHSEDLIQIQINTKDQKGLFAYISYIFDTYNVEIQSAKINTKNNKVNDLLLVEKNGNFISNKDKIIDLITSS